MDGQLTGLVQELASVLTESAADERSGGWGWDVSVAHAVLLHGPSGEWKTRRLLSALQESGLKHAVLHPTELISEYPGFLPRGLLRAVHELEVAGAPAVLVIPRIEVLCPDVGAEPTKAECGLVDLLSGLRAKRLALVAVSSEPDRIGRLLAAALRWRCEVSLLTADERAAWWASLLAPMGAGAEDALPFARELVGFGRSDCARLARDAYIAWSQSGGRLCDILAQLHGAYRPLLATAFSITAPAVGWDAIGGLASIKTHLRGLVASGAGLPSAWLNGTLLYGPPGTGKTLLAKAVASDAGASFLSASVSGLLRAELGASERLIADMFRVARAAAPCVVFLDEVQALFGARGEADMSAADAKMVSQLCLELDRLSLAPGVLVLAATNTPAAIDSALLRHGRIGHRVYVALPDAAERAAILALHCRRLPLDYGRLAALGDGLSGAELRAACQQAGRAALARSSPGASGRGTDVAALMIEQADLEALLAGAERRVTSRMLAQYQAFAKASE